MTPMPAKLTRKIGFMSSCEIICLEGRVVEGREALLTEIGFGRQGRKALDRGCSRRAHGFGIQEGVHHRPARQRACDGSSSSQVARRIEADSENSGLGRVDEGAMKALTEEDQAGS